MVLLKVTNRNALVCTKGGQIFPASVDLEFQPEVVNASAAFSLLVKPV